MGDIELQIFADRLKELRTLLELTQAEFVIDLGITASALSAYEKNQKNPSISVAKRIAEKYNISIDWLCGLSETMNHRDKPRKYSDIIKILLDIEKYLDIGVYTEWKDNSDPYNQSPTYKPFLFAEIIFNNQLMKEFMVEWEKMKQLHDDGTIDEDVYTLWIEKTLKKYDKDLVGNGWEEKIPFDTN